MSIFEWLMSGPDGPYMNLVHCMREDWFWIGFMVVANTAVILGYLEFARRNYKAYKLNKAKNGDSETGDAYMSLIGVFIFCALCGYLYPIIAIYYPIKKVFIMLTFILSLITWRLILKANSIDFYNQMFRKSK